MNNTHFANWSVVLRSTHTYTCGSGATETILMSQFQTSLSLFSFMNRVQIPYSIGIIKCSFHVQMQIHNEQRAHTVKLRFPVVDFMCLWQSLLIDGKYNKFSVLNAANNVPLNRKVKQHEIRNKNWYTLFVCRIAIIIKGSTN